MIADAIEKLRLIDFAHPMRNELSTVLATYDGSVADDHCRFELIVEDDELLSLVISRVECDADYGEKPRRIRATALERVDLQTTKSLLAKLNSKLPVKFTEYDSRGEVRYSWSGDYEMFSMFPNLSQSFSAWTFVLEAE